jgi:hypothetical protein
MPSGSPGPFLAGTKNALVLKYHCPPEPPLCTQWAAVPMRLRRGLLITSAEHQPVVDPSPLTM